MLRSRFFWKLYASYLLLVVVTTVLLGWLVDARMAHTLDVAREGALRDQLVSLEPFAQRCFQGLESETEIQRQLRGVARATETRITLVRSDGVILADSDQDPKRMENHGDRPEVRDARTSPVGVAERHSDTLGYSMLYMARAIPGLDGAVLRVSVPARQGDRERSALRATIALVAGLALLASLLLGLFVAGRINRPIADMTRVAEELRAGNYKYRVERRSNDELGVLADTLNRLGAQVAQRIETISEDRARLGAILAGLNDGVIAVDESDHVLFCNVAAGRIFKVDRERSVGAALDTVTRPARFGELLAAARARGGSVHEEMTLERAERPATLEAVATPFASGEPGAAQGVALVLQDVTDLRALERVRRDFVANVSHELKTPLTSIKGYVETIQDGGVDEAMQARFLEKIQRNSDRLGHLVSDLLSLSRIEAQVGAPELEPVELDLMVAEAGRRYEDAARDKRLALEVRSQERIVVLGDREGLTEICDNLLDNAIKYTSSGGRIRLVLSRDDSTATLTVEDTGAGIPEQDLERVFERFYRVDKARSRELGGSGLGLSIVKHLVQAMRGVVEVRSRVGEGSCFTVRLPLAKGSSRPPSSAR